MTETKAHLTHLAGVLKWDLDIVSAFSPNHSALIYSDYIKTKWKIAKSLRRLIKLNNVQWSYVGTQQTSRDKERCSSQSKWVSRVLSRHYRRNKSELHYCMWWRIPIGRCDQLRVSRCKLDSCDLPELTLHFIKIIKTMEKTQMNVWDICSDWNVKQNKIPISKVLQSNGMERSTLLWKDNTMMFRR